MQQYMLVERAVSQQLLKISRHIVFYIEEITNDFALKLFCFQNNLKNEVRRLMNEAERLNTDIDRTSNLLAAESKVSQTSDICLIYIDSCDPWRKFSIFLPHRQMKCDALVCAVVLSCHASYVGSNQLHVLPDDGGRASPDTQPRQKSKACRGKWHLSCLIQCQKQP